GHRDLGIHSGLIGDAVLDLIEGGAVTNAAKPIDTGMTVAGLLFGTRRLYDFAHQNPDLALRPGRHTHGAGVLARLDRFVAI
ncbi:acetyl-CoA hydrolase, partial [Acinetobacter baumannii]